MTRRLLWITLLCLGCLPAQAAGESVSLRKHGHKDGIGFLEFSPDGARLISAGSGLKDRKVHLWSVSDRKKLFTFERHKPDKLSGQTLGAFLGAEGGRGGWMESRIGLDRVVFFDASSGKQLGSIGIERASCLALSPDGQWLAVGTRAPFAQREKRLRQFVKVYSMKTYDLVHDLPAQLDEVTTLVFSGDGKRLISGGWYTETKPSGFSTIGDLVEYGLLQWDMSANAAPLARLAKEEAASHRTLALTHDGDRVAFATLDDRVLVWSTTSDTLVRAIQLPKKAHVSSLCFTHDGRHLFIAGVLPKEVWIVDSVSGKRVSRFKVDPKSCRCLALSPDGKQLATGGSSYLKVWDVASLVE